MGKMLTLASSGHLAATTSSGGAGNYTFLIVIVVLFALFYFVMIRPQRNRQRQVQQMQNQIGPGQRIRTTAGMYATVTEVEGDDVVLELAPGVNVRFMRRAIMDVVPDETGTDGLAPMTADDEAGAPAAGDTSAAAAEETSVADGAGTPQTADAGRAAKPGAEDGTSAS